MSATYATWAYLKETQIKRRRFNRTLDKLFVAGNVNMFLESLNSLINSNYSVDFEAS